MAVLIAFIGVMGIWFTVLTYRAQKERRKRQQEREQNESLRNEIKYYKREIDTLNNKLYGKGLQEDDEG